VRAIAIANGKGGVGKTTITANLSGLLAAAGYRVLAVDTDPQGNLARDLAYEGDGGQSLALAIQHGKPLEPLREVRPNLDVIAGGEALADVAAVAISRSSRGGDLTAVLATRLPQLTTIAGEPYVKIGASRGSGTRPPLDRQDQLFRPYDGGQTSSGRTRSAMLARRRTPESASRCPEDAPASGRRHASASVRAR